MAVENGRISNFEGFATLTLTRLTLDRVILHTVVHQSLTSTYMPNFITIKKNFCGQLDVRTHARMYVCMYVRTDGLTFETGFISIRSTLSKSQPKNKNQNIA